MGVVWPETHDTGGKAMTRLGFNPDYSPTPELPAQTDAERELAEWRTVRRFECAGEWAAWSEAVEWLESRGFSVGRMQRGSPIGCLFGYYDIQKWRNLNEAERVALHVLVTADDWRNGPVTLTLGPTASREAVAAFMRVGHSPAPWHIPTEGLLS